VRSGLICPLVSWLIVTAVGFAAPVSGSGQEPEDEPLLAELTRTLKSRPLSVTVLIQAGLDVQPDRTLPGENGFRVPNLRFGLFKSPFSHEFLTSAASLDFVRRSQVVSALAPARRIGAQLRGALGGGLIAYRLGVFNGNGFDSQNDTAPSSTRPASR